VARPVEGEVVVHALAPAKLSQFVDRVVSILRTWPPQRKARGRPKLTPNPKPSAASGQRIAVNGVRRRRRPAG
jgi:hypothetical protein